MARQIVLTVPFLFLLLSTCPKPSPVNGIDVNRKEENVDDSPSRERIARQSSAGGPSSNKEFNGGIYWLAADGPDFQMWPAMGAAGYGSGGQQQQMANLGAMGQSNGQQQQASGQQQSANPGGQQPSSSMSGIQQQAIVAQQQQQMFPQIQQQGFPQSAFAGYGQMSGGQQQQSAYAGYLEKQISSYPVMIYTLADCIPCQRAKHLLAVHYPDVRAHYLELSGNEPWQQQLQIDLQYLTGAMTFPYIFVCGQYIGGSTELFELHESGQLRRLVSQCLQKPPPK